MSNVSLSSRGGKILRRSTVDPNAVNLLLSPADFDLFLATHPDEGVA